MASRKCMFGFIGALLLSSFAVGSAPAAAGGCGDYGCEGPAPIIVQPQYSTCSCGGAASYQAYAPSYAYPSVNYGYAAPAYGYGYAAPAYGYGYAAPAYGYGYAGRYAPYGYARAGAGFYRGVRSYARGYVSVRGGRFR